MKRIVWACAVAGSLLAHQVVAAPPVACRPPPGAPKSSTAMYCGVTYLLTGKCDNSDQVYKWTVGGGLPMKGKHPYAIYPWEDVWITIRGIELTQISGGPATYWMAGINHYGDVLAYIGPNQRHTRHDFPAGTGVRWMPKSQQTETSYLDLHGLCSGGETVSVFFTIYYTVP